MILRPVRPQSPTGPPITNLPVGLMWNLVPLCSHLAGSTGLSTCSRTASTRSFCFTPGSCWVDSTTRSEEHTSELQSLMRISYAVFCLKKKKIIRNLNLHYYTHHTPILISC